MAKKKADLKARLEEEIGKLMDAQGEPSEGRMKLIALGIKMAALNAKLEESDYGEFFRDDGDTGSVSERKGKESGAGKRANGSAEPTA